MISVWWPWNTAFPVYPHRENSHFMSQLCQYLISPQLRQPCVVPTSTLHGDSDSLTPGFDACHSLASWHQFYLCVSSHLSIIFFYSLLNCHIQPQLGLSTTFCYQHFRAFSLAFMWKPLPWNACISLTPKPLLWHHMYKNSSAELGCLKRFCCSVLTSPVLWHLPS